TRQPEAPPPCIVDRLYATAAHQRPEDFGVLEMDVENVSGEFASGFDRVDHLPGEMRRVHLDANVRRVVERAEEGCECHWAGGDVSGIDVGFPEDSDFVFLA